MTAEDCFTKSGGNLGTDGSVSYMFNRKGSIIIQDAYEEDKMLEVSLDAGAEDFEHVEDTFVISTDSHFKHNSK
jgi:transcriptional/translational regulatory protein YebC/TACO1